MNKKKAICSGITKVAILKRTVLDKNIEKKYSELKENLMKNSHDGQSMKEIEDELNAFIKDSLLADSKAVKGFEVEIIDLVNDRVKESLFIDKSNIDRYFHK